MLAAAVASFLQRFQMRSSTAVWLSGAFLAMPLFKKNKKIKHFINGSCFQATRPPPALSGWEWNVEAKG